MIKRLEKTRREEEVDYQLSREKRDRKERRKLKKAKKAARRAKEEKKKEAIKKKKSKHYEDITWDEDMYTTNKQMNMTAGENIMTQILLFSLNIFFAFLRRIRRQFHVVWWKTKNNSQRL
jgi:hypothetical protein